MFVYTSLKLARIKSRERAPVMTILPERKHRYTPLSTFNSQDKTRKQVGLVASATRRRPPTVFPAQEAPRRLWKPPEILYPKVAEAHVKPALAKEMLARFHPANRARISSFAPVHTMLPLAKISAVVRGLRIRAVAAANSFGLYSTNCVLHANRAKSM